MVQAASTLPMMAPRRWVHLRELHKLKAAEQGPLLAYADAQDDLELGVEAATRWLHFDYLNEAVQQRLMTLLARSGRDGPI